MPDSYQHRFSGLNHVVHVADTVWEEWDRHRQTKSATPETAGVMIGMTNQDRKEIWIQTVTTLKDNDEQGRCHFKLTDPAHQAYVDKEFSLSSGTHIYLGTWHTHPQPIPEPSRVDIKNWESCLLRNRERPLVFSIVGIQQTQIYIKHKSLFVALGQGD